MNPPRPILALALAALALAASGPARAAIGDMRKGPYLIYRNEPTEMTVLWQFRNTAACTLEWGPDETCANPPIPSSEYGDHQHAVTLTGLEPGRLYHYRVRLGDETEGGLFRAAPSPTTNRLKFTGFGDTRTSMDNFRTVSRQVVDRLTADPEYHTFLLHSGDWVENGADESYWDNEHFLRGGGNERVQELLAKIPVMGCIGNHEFYGGSRELYTKYYPYSFVETPNPADQGAYFAFDYGPVHFVCLDLYQDTGNTNHDYFAPGTPQHNWALNSLLNTDREWKIIVYHPVAYGGNLAGFPNDGTMQNHLHDTLAVPGGADIVFFGHSHYYSRCHVDGIQYVLSGAGGGPLGFPGAGTGYQTGFPTFGEFLSGDGASWVAFEIDGNQLTMRCYDYDGDQRDEFTIIHPDTRPPTGSVLINDGAQYAGTLAANLKLEAWDSGTGVDKMRLRNAGENWGGWIDYATSAPIDLTGDGVRTVEVQFMDKAGNASQTFRDDITVDREQPTGSVTIQ